MAIYVTSDNHFCEKWEERGFSSESQLNDYLIEKWNQIVQPNDEIYVLGNFAHGQIKSIEDVFKRLNGKITIFYNDTCEQFLRPIWEKIGAYKAIHYSYFSSKLKLNFYYYQDKIKRPLEEDWLICYGGEQDSNPVWSDYGLSVNAAYWDNCPVNIDDVRDIWERMKDWQEEK
jgi:calcineurin-like phosphoesterase family protein